MQGAVVCDHLAGEERDTDNDQQERVEGRAGDKQTRSKHSWIIQILALKVIIKK